MKKALFFLFSLVLGICLFFFVAKYMVNWQEVEKGFRHLSFWKLLLVALFTLLIFFLEIWRWLEILKKQGDTISFKKLIEPYLAFFPIVYLVPVALIGADFFRARAIEKDSSLSSSKRIASVFIDRIFSSFTNLVVICLTSLVFLSRANVFNKGMAEVYSAVVIFFVFIFLSLGVILFYSKIFKKNRFLKIFLKDGQEQIGEELKNEIFSFFRKKNFFCILKILWISLLRFLAMAGQYWLLALFLGYSLSPFSLMVIFGFSLTAMETSISADLGSHDLANTIVFEKIGAGRNIGFAFTLILRSISLILAAVGLFFLLKISLHLFENNLLKRIEKIFPGKNEKQQ